MNLIIDLHCNPDAIAFAYAKDENISMKNIKIDNINVSNCKYNCIDIIGTDPYEGNKSRPEVFINNAILSCDNYSQSCLDIKDSEKV